MVDVRAVQVWSKVGCSWMLYIFDPQCDQLISEFWHFFCIALFASPAFFSVTDCRILCNQPSAVTPTHHHVAFPDPRDPVHREI